jgi:phosphoenolpyruvate-protein kinase (PTS system EI component)
MVIPMIETPDAVELADEFLSIDGVDGILIGSNDLCTDLGIPGQYDNPLYQESVSKIVRAGVRAGKPIGIGGIGGRLDLLERWFLMGATWSLSGADGAMLQAGMQKLGKVYGGINERVQEERARHFLDTKDKVGIMEEVKAVNGSSCAMEVSQATTVSGGSEVYIRLGRFGF